jgi:hypothetical protein
LPTSRPSPTTRPPEHVFFLDRDLGGIILPRALKNAGYIVEPFQTQFNQNTKDVDWFPVVAAHGWIALSRNRKQRYVPSERDVAMRSGLALFHLIRPGSHTALAPILVGLIPKIIAFRNKHEPPFIARVYRAGRVVMDLSLTQWQVLSGGAT